MCRPLLLSFASLRGLAFFLLAAAPTSAAAAGTITVKGSPQACVARKDVGTADGNVIHLWSCSGAAANLSWTYDKSTGYITAGDDGKGCLSLRNAGTDNGNPVHLWSCKNDEKQKWDYDPASGFVKLRSNAKKCLGKKNAGLANANPMHLWDCKESDNLKWDLSAASSPAAEAGDVTYCTVGKDWMLYAYQRAVSRGYHFECKYDSFGYLEGTVVVGHADFSTPPMATGEGLKCMGAMPKGDFTAQGSFFTSTPPKNGWWFHQIVVTGDPKGVTTEVGRHKAGVVFTSKSTKKMGELFNLALVSFTVAATNKPGTCPDPKTLVDQLF